MDKKYQLSADTSFVVRL